ncbi:unnamed protein product [Phaedon cochleariae]|uniref:Uncharacterized protein n=1 Tax=Phaedon cochleariae TaxID=80249 RepID=A0A9P0DMA0_PHACE|nr:unnamed protein product [Phaedon cochleariae]
MIISFLTGEYDMEGGHAVQDENSYQNEESIDGVQDENIYQNEESINGDWSSYSSAKLRTPRTKILGKFPICPVNNGHADVDIDQFICSQEDVEQICIIETNGDDSSPNTYVLEIPSQPVSSASDTTPRHKKPNTKVASESSSAFEISNKPSFKSLSSAKSTDKSPSTRHLSTSRRRPIISQTKNEEFADAKIKALSAANEYAAEQHGIIMEIYKEKMKQESLATQIMEEKLKTLKRKNSVLPRSDEGDSS